MRMGDYELSVPFHMIRRAQFIATESRNNVLSHKNEEDRQLNRHGDVVGGSGKEGRYERGVVNI